MERKEAMKMEDLIKSSYFNDGFLGSNNNMLTGFLDFNGEAEKGSSLGFMELLGMQDFDASVFDMSHHQQQALVIDQTEMKKKTQISTGVVVQEPSEPEVVHTPATPNSSSISSESTGAAPPNETQSKSLDDDEQHHNTKKLLKPKKTSQKKKQREARFAFMTKSDVDHLEDGYRWRKYGQKAVKNSPFPRSYYRCTSASCNVKKRVERCFNDPSIVVTTYEGQHTHLSPMMPRHTPVGLPPGFSLSANTANTHFPQAMHFASSHQPEIINNLTSFADPVHQELYSRQFCNTPQYSAALLKDNGLLQDIVPSIIRREE